MGGGGSFGWFVQRDFTVGSTGRCETFHNPPLVKGDIHSFEISDLEVYVFTSMSERLSSGKPSLSSFGSISGRMSMHSLTSTNRKLSFSSTSSGVVSLFE